MDILAQTLRKEGFFALYKGFFFKSLSASFETRTFDFQEC